MAALNSSSGRDPIELLTTRHNWIFGASVIVALLVILVSFLVWKSGNELNAAIIKKVDADAMVAIAKVESAAKERIEEAKRESNEKIAQLNKETAEAKSSLEHERIERLKLEAQVAPRRLSRKQRKGIAEACRALGHKGPVRVASYSLDVESGVLAGQIIDALKEGGITVDEARASQLPVGEFRLGIHVTGEDRRLVENLASILASSGGLEVAPLNFPSKGALVLAPTAKMEPIPAVILVGVKPIRE